MENLVVSQGTAIHLKKSPSSHHHNTYDFSLDPLLIFKKCKFWKISKIAGDVLYIN